MRRLGAVQKAGSLTSAVRRVQGPVTDDDSIKMRGSMVFMEPSDKMGRVPGDVLPHNVPVVGVNQFTTVKQTEEWDLKRDELRPNLYRGTIVILREPMPYKKGVSENEDTKNDSLDFGTCDTIKLEYDCEIILSDKPQEFA